MKLTAVLIFASLAHSSRKLSGGRKRRLGKQIFSGLVHRLVTASRSVFGEHVFLAVPVDEVRDFNELGGQLLLQVGETFGEKLRSSIHQIFEKGYEQVLVLGDDCPSLDCQVLRKAQARFLIADVVVGPDHKGGVYLLGFSCFQEQILASIDWNANCDFAQICEQSQPGLRLAVLEPRPDLDDVTDLKRIIEGWRGATARWLRQLLQNILAEDHLGGSATRRICFSSLFAHIRLTNQLPPPSEPVD